MSLENSLQIINQNNYAVIINGINFNDYFENLNILWRIDEVARTLDLEMTFTEDQVFPNIAANDTIQIFCLNRLYFNGFIEVINPSYDKERLTFQLQGRSLTADVVDSTVGSHIEFSGKVSLQTIITTLNQRLAGANLKITTNVQNTEETLEDEQFKANPDTPLFDFLDRLARRFNLFVTSDAKGDIILLNVNSNQAPKYYLNHQFHKVNDLIICDELNASIDVSERFYEYRVHGKLNTTTRTSKVNTDSIYAVASSFDNSIRSSRILDIIMETDTVNKSVLQKRADWEKATRIGRSISFVANLFSLQDPNTNEFYDINNLMQINDEATKVKDNLLVKEIRLNLNKEDGVNLELEMTSADAFIPEPIPRVKQKVKSKKLRRQNLRNKRRQDKNNVFNNRTQRETFADRILDDDYQRGF